MSAERKPTPTSRAKQREQAITQQRHYPAAPPVLVPTRPLHDKICNATAKGDYILSELRYRGQR